LVGYARLKDAGQTKEGRTKAMDLFETEEPLKKQLTLVKAQAATYRTNQANQGASYADKQALAAQMTVTAEVLNLRLADAYKVDVRDDSAYKSWKTSHRPFHWCSEFYEIVEERGGFDVIVGNPPYVEYAKVRNDYTIIGYETESCGNLYANTFERSQQISNGKTIGVIVPMSGHSTERMDTLIGLY
ncbi:MAG: Eco57I restriction-modification methylase domain-containing protein, partial [Roseiflexaceae bacterium]